MDTSQAFDALIQQATAESAARQAQAETQTQQSNAVNLANAYQIGQKIAAERRALPLEEQRRYGTQMPTNYTLAEMAAMGKGMEDYRNDLHSMDNAGALDYGQTFAAGLTEGIIDTTAAIPVLGVGGAMDLSESYANSVREKYGLAPVEHNYLGSLNEGLQQFSKGIGSVIRNDEEEALNRALALNRAARQKVTDTKYQEDLNAGYDEFTASLRDIGRSTLKGVSNFTDSPIQAIDTTANAIGQLGSQGLIKGIINKAVTGSIAKGLGNKWADRITNTSILGATEAMGSVGESAQMIDSMSNEQLLQQSPQFAELVQENLNSGKDTVRAFNDARTALKRIASYYEATIGGASALAAAGITNPLEPFQKAVISNITKGALKEGTEELLTGLGQGIGSNVVAMNTYEPERRWSKDVGSNMAESALGGFIAGGAMRTPGTIYGVQQQAKIEAIRKEYEKQQTIKKGEKSLLTHNEDIIKQADERKQTKAQQQRDEAINNTISSDSFKNAETGKSTINAINDVSDQNANIANKVEKEDTPLDYNSPLVPQIQSKIEESNNKITQNNQKTAENNIKQKEDIDDDYSHKYTVVPVESNGKSVTYALPKESELRFPMRIGERNISFFNAFDIQPSTTIDVALKTIDDLDDIAKSDHSKINLYKAYIHAYDIIKRKSELVMDIVNKAKEDNPDKTFTLLPEQRSANIFLKVSNGVPLTEEDFKSDTPEETEYIKNLAEDTEQFFKRGYDYYKQELTRLLNKQLKNEKIDSEAKADTVTAALATGIVNLNDTKVQTYLKELENKIELTESEERLFNVYKLLKVGNKFGLDTLRTERSKNVSSNLYLVDDPKTGRLAIATFLENIIDGVANDDIGQIRSNLAHLYMLGSTRINKLQGFRRQLVNKSTEPFEYSVVRVKDETLVTRSSRLESFNLIDTVEDEVANTVNAINTIINSLKEDKTFRQVLEEDGFEEITPITRLPNEKELKEAFKKAHPEVKGEIRDYSSKTETTTTTSEVTTTIDEISENNENKVNTTNKPNTKETVIIKEKPVIEEKETNIVNKENTQKEDSIQIVEENEKKADIKETPLKEEKVINEPKETIINNENNNNNNKKTETEDNEKFDINNINRDLGKASMDNARERADYIQTLEKIPLEERRQYLDSLDSTSRHKLETQLRNKKLQEHIDKGHLAVDLPYDPNRFTVSTKQPVKAKRPLANTLESIHTFTNNESMQKKIKKFKMEDFRDIFNSFIYKVRAELFSYRKDFNKNDGLLYEDKYQGWIEDSNKYRKEAEEKAIKAAKFSDMPAEELKKLSRNSAEDLKKDIEQANSYLDNWSKFIREIVFPQKETEENKSSAKIVSYVKDGFEKTLDFSKLIYNLQKKEEEITLGQTKSKFDWNNIVKDRQLMVFFEYDNNGNLVMNEAVEKLSGIAVLETLQQLGKRINTKQDVTIDNELQKFDIEFNDIKPFLSEDETTVIRSGMALEPVIDLIASNIGEALGITSNRKVSKDMDGNSVLKELAQIALLHMQYTGAIRIDTYRFEYVEDLNPEVSNTVSIERVTDRNKPADFGLQYVTSLAAFYKDNPEAKAKYSYLFRTSGIARALEENFFRTKEKDVYYSQKDLPKIPKTKLRSSVKNTKAEQEAMKHMRSVPYFLDKDIESIIRNQGEQGYLKVCGLNEIPNDSTYNEETRASLEGKRRTAIDGYNIVLERAATALMNRPDNPFLYLDGNYNRAGRWQENAPYGGQADKLHRYTFSNVKYPIPPTSSQKAEDIEANVAFQRAALQALGFKVKNMEDSEITETFSTMEKAFADKVKDITDIKEYAGNVDNYLDLLTIAEKSINGKRENGPISYSFIVNMFRYVKAKEANTSFENTLPLELDGSCNGYANSVIKQTYSDGFTTNDIINASQSNIYLGDSDMTSTKGYKRSKKDNYTSVAERTTTKIMQLLTSIAAHSRIQDANERKNLFPELKYKDSRTGYVYEVNSLSLGRGTYNVINIIMPGDVEINTQALMNDANNSDIEGEPASISRSITKKPTMRINYSQGKYNNTIEFIKDMSEKLSERFTDILKNPKLPVYQAFFLKEIESGKLDLEQARKNFINFIIDLSAIENFTIKSKKDKKTGNIVHYISQTKEFTDILPMALLRKDVIDSPLKDIPEFIQEALKTTILGRKGVTTDQFINNIATYFADPLFQAVDEGRSIDFKEPMDILINVTNSFAAIQNALLKEAIEIVRNDSNHNGLMPSDDEIAIITRKISRRFPTVISTKSASLDLAASTMLRVNDAPQEQVLNTQTLKYESKDKSIAKHYQIQSRQVSNLKIQSDSPYLQGKTIKSFTVVPIGIQTPIPNRAAASPLSVIGFGDGHMQTNLFTDPNNDLENVNRYDGVDTNPLRLKKNSEVINKAAINILDEFPLYSQIQNIEQAIKTLETDKKDKDKPGYAYRVDIVYSALYTQNSIFKAIEDNRKAKIDKVEAMLSYFNAEKSRLEEYLKRDFIRVMTIKNSPYSMQHMSASPDGYTYRDFRDNFHIPEGLTIEAAAEYIVDVMNHRYNILKPNFDKYWKEYLKTGKIPKAPDNFYEYNPDFLEDKDPTKIYIKLISSKPDTVKRKVPNVQGDNRVIPRTADLDIAPKRQTVEIQPQATNTSSNRTGRITLDFDRILHNFYKTIPVTVRPIAIDFYTRFLNDNLKKNIQVLLVEDISKLANKQREIFEQNPQTPAIYDIEENTIYLRGPMDIDAIEEDKEFNKIIIHELTHAIIGSRIHTIYELKDINATAYKEYLLLKDLRNSYLDYLEKDKIYYAVKEYDEDDFKEQFALTRSFLSKEDIAKFRTDTAFWMNEFIVHMLSNTSFIDTSINSRIKASKMSKEADSIFGSLIAKFAKVLSEIFHIRIGKGKKAYKDLEVFQKTFYGRANMAAAYILEKYPNDTNHYSAVEYIDAPPPIQTYVSLNPKLNILTARLNDLSAKYARYRLFNEPKSTVTTQDIAMEIRDYKSNTKYRLINAARDYNIPLNDNQINTATTLAFLYDSAINLNSSIKLDAIALRNEILDNLNPNDLIFVEDHGDTLAGRARHEYLSALFNNGASLGVFMGLLAVNDSLRNVIDNTVKKINRKKFSINPIVKLSDSKVDTMLTYIGERALQEINSFLDSPVNRKDKLASQVIDELNLAITNFNLKQSALSSVSGLIDRANEAISNKIDNLGTNFLDSARFKKLIKEDSSLASFIAKGLKISVPFLLKDTNERYIANKKMILSLINQYGKENPSFFSRLLTSTYKELMSTDKKADQVYKIQKQAKAIVQASRNNWREIVPIELKNKFKAEGVTLSKEQLASMNAVILQSDIGALNQEEIQKVMSGNIDSLIREKSGELSSIALDYAKNLAHYMVTGEASHGMLRNAEAIASYSKMEKIAKRSSLTNADINKQDDVTTIDAIITLLALNEQKEALKEAQEIYKKAPKAFEYSIAQQRHNRQEEAKKATSIYNRKYNIYKGFYPRDRINTADVKVVTPDKINKYLGYGYEIIGTTQDKTAYYIRSTYSPLVSFTQGGLQTIINQVGGIDETTGWSPNSKVYKRIKSPKKIAAIQQSYKTGEKAEEAWLPILDETGSTIVGYERAVNPAMYKSIQYQFDFTKNIGAWKGRQIEESMAYDLNKNLIDTLKNQYESAPDYEKKQYTDVIALSKRDPVIKEALDNISPKVLKYLSGKSELPDSWFIRNDLIEDVIGRRQASILDFASGNTRWSPEVQAKVSNIVKSVLGPKGFTYLYRAENIIKSTTASMRNFIVIRSGEVCAMNILSNILSLMIRGIPINEIVKEIPRITKELESYNISRQRQAILQMEINAERGSNNPSINRIKLLQNKLNDEKNLIKHYTYSNDLLEAGEYNTIADIGDINDDILLSTGKFGEYLEKQVDKLPNMLKEAGRQIILTKDSAIYRALEKGTRYGDFIAKAIYYNHLIKKKGFSKEDALSRVRYEFVNYDMLPGRTREYLENIGLLWFYNYKLRVSRTAMSMLKENPLSSLISLSAPIDLGVGTPLSDNFFGKILTNPFGSMGIKLFDVPWVSNHMWYNLFS